MALFGKQLRRLDIVGEILYNSCAKIRTIKHGSKSMAPRLPPNSDITVKPALTYNVGDVVAAEHPKTGEVNFLRVLAGPKTEMISDDIPPREMKLESSSYWLEADNAVQGIEDSRDFGPVHTTNIVGRALNIELGGTYHPIMVNSAEAVEQDNRDAWTFPYLIKSFSDFSKLVKLSGDDYWVEETLRTRVRCRVMAEQHSRQQPVAEPEVPEVVVA